jgi:hypothetical protein
LHPKYDKGITPQMVTTRAKTYNRQPSIIGEEGTSRGRNSTQIPNSRERSPIPTSYFRHQPIEEENVEEDNQNVRIEEVNPPPPMDLPNPVDAMMAPGVCPS